MENLFTSTSADGRVVIQEVNEQPIHTILNVSQVRLMGNNIVISTPEEIILVPDTTVLCITRSMKTKKRVGFS